MRKRPRSDREHEEWREGGRGIGGERRALIAVQLSSWLTSRMNVSVNPLTGECHLCGRLPGDGCVFCCWARLTGEGAEDG